MKVHDREFSVGLEPDSYGGDMVNILKPGYNWRKQLESVKVRWSATSEQTPDDAHKFAQTLVMGIKLARRIQEDFDIGKLTSEATMQRFIVGDQAP